MKTFENFNKSNVRYITDKQEYVCPVCGSEELESNFQSREYMCKSCSFDFSYFFDFEYSGAETYFEGAFLETIIKGDNIASDEDEAILKIPEKLNPKRIYLTNGYSNENCPFCNTELPSNVNSDTNGDEYYDDMVCDVCNNEWRSYRIEKYKYTVDENNNEIKKGEIVDPELFDFDGYKKEKIRQKTNDFNI